jgi:hypothetical protein
VEKLIFDLLDAQRAYLLGKDADTKKFLESLIKVLEVIRRVENDDYK